MAQPSLLCPECNRSFDQESCVCGWQPASGWARAQIEPEPEWRGELRERLKQYQARRQRPAAGNGETAPTSVPPHAAIRRSTAPPESLQAANPAPAAVASGARIAAPEAASKPEVGPRILPFRSRGGAALALAPTLEVEGRQAASAADPQPDPAQPPLSALLLAAIEASPAAKLQCEPQVTPLAGLAPLVEHPPVQQVNPPEERATESSLWEEIAGGGPRNSEGRPPRAGEEPGLGGFTFSLENVPATNGSGRPEGDEAVPPSPQARTSQTPEIASPRESAPPQVESAPRQPLLPLKETTAPAEHVDSASAVPATAVSTAQNSGWPSPPASDLAEPVVRPRAVRETMPTAWGPLPAAQEPQRGTRWKTLEPSPRWASEIAFAELPETPVAPPVSSELAEPVRRPMRERRALPAPIPAEHDPGDNPHVSIFSTRSLLQEPPPAIELPVCAAPPAQRVRAGLRDARNVLSVVTCFALTAWAVMGFPRAFAPGLSHKAWLKLVLPVGGASLVLLLAAYLLLSFRLGEATPGMDAAGLVVRTFDGETASRGRRTVRALMSLLSILALGLGFFWMWVDDDQLTWHDHISRTYLTRREAL